MTRSFTQVPPDSTGDKLVMRSYVAGADTLHSQGVHFDGLPTYRLLCESGAQAANKYHIYLGNNTGSAQSLFLLRAYTVNLQTAAVTGPVARYNFRRVTGTPTLTAVTPYAFNSADPPLANVTAGHTVTAGLTDSTLVQPIILSTDEQTPAAGNGTPYLQLLSMLPTPDPHGRPLVLRPGEAMAIRQVDATTVGSFAWIFDFSIEAD